MKALDLFCNISDLLNGYRTVLTTTVGSLFNLLALTHIVKVPFEGMLAANLAFLVVAGIFRLLARRPGPLA